MLKNYIKIAFRVMLRQKFFTAVSLFGISFTIMILSLFAGTMNLMFGNVAPAVNRDRTLYLDGARIYDANKKSSAVTMDDAFYKDIKNLKGVERVSVYSLGGISFLRKGKKIRLQTAFTDEEIWNIYRFEFLEGGPFNVKDVIDGHSVAVITQSVKNYYFGDGPAVGKYIQGNPKIKVIGVVKDYVTVFKFTGTESAGIYIPLTRYSNFSKGSVDSYDAVLLAGKRSDIPLIKSEMLQLINQKYNPSGGEVSLNARDIYEMIHFEAFAALMAAFIILVMVVPALNMVGLNINRISERSSEIGIRKAFGASSSVLAAQFITENLIITFLGGALGILLTIASSGLAVGLLYNNKDIAPSGNLVINWNMIIYALVASLVFGLISGALPAWRMSRLHIESALKGGNL